MLLESVTYMGSEAIDVEEIVTKCPLRHWNDAVQTMTSIMRESDIKLVYQQLGERVNEKWYEQKLDEDPTLFLNQEDSESYQTSFESDVGVENFPHLR